MVERSDDFWISELKNKLSCEVSVSKKVLEEHSFDASIFELKPKVVVFVRNTRDVCELVKFVNEYNSKIPRLGKNKSGKKKNNDFLKLTLTARAAGTCMSGGPLSESIVVSFTKYMNKLVSLNKNYAIVEPGLYYHDMEKKMDKISVFYPSYPASKSICALGGMVANNAGSEKNLVYGQTVKHVKELKVVLSDGKEYKFGPLDLKGLHRKMKVKGFEGDIYRKMYRLLDDNYSVIKKAEPATSKNSCGYLLWKVWDRKKEIFDLSKIFVGSQGTLGLWSQAKVRVAAKKKHSRLVAVYLKDLEQMTKVVNSVLPYSPESLESFDRNTMFLGMRFMPQIARKTGKKLLSMLWGFRREALLTLRNGFPVFIILVEITGDKLDDVLERIGNVNEEISGLKVAHLVMRSEEEGEKYWTIRRESFNLLREHVKGKQAVPFVDDFAVDPAKLGSFLPKLYKLLSYYGIKPTLAGHAGDGNFHVIPLMDLSDEKEKAKIPIVLSKFVKLVLSHGGTITAEHNDGLIRTTFVKNQYSKRIVKIFEEVKDIFDPKKIFNPRKKVRGDFKFAMQHVKKKRKN